MSFDEIREYTKKPITIEAVRYMDQMERQHIIDWIGDACRYTGMDDDGCMYETAALFIQTLEGEMMANEGDWIIKGVKGEFYPCKDDVFQATYEV